MSAVATRHPAKTVYDAIEFSTSPMLVSLSFQTSYLPAREFSWWLTVSGFNSDKSWRKLKSWGVSTNRQDFTP